jgi:hypothetical protein
LEELQMVGVDELPLEQITLYRKLLDS